MVWDVHILCNTTEEERKRGERTKENVCVIFTACGMGVRQTLSLQRSSAEALVTQVLQSEGPVVILLLSQFH